MLGSKDRHRINQRYFDAREQIRVFPKWLRVSAVWLMALFLGLMAYLMSGFGYSFMPILLIFCAWFYGRRIVCYRPLLKYRGEICPCCWSRSSKPKPGCPGCESPAGRDAHRTYWRVMRVSFPFAEQAFSDRFLGAHQKAPMTRLMKGFIALIIAVPILAVLWIVIATVYFNDLSWMDSGNPAWIWIVGFPAGILVVYFAKRRVGESKHCARCDYQLAPVGGRPDECPECGNDLRKKGAVNIGRSVGSRWPLVVVYAVIGLFVLLPMLNLFDGLMLSPTRLVPTSKFISHVISVEDIDFSLRRKLESRRLDDGHLTDLIDEIELRLEGGDEALALDEHRWDGHVSDLIVAESAQRNLPQPIKLRLLHLYHAWERSLPYDLRQWVDQEVAAGSFSQAELQAAEMMKPIKRAQTETLLKEFDRESQGRWSQWEIYLELGLRKLNERQLLLLCDQIAHRIQDQINTGIDHKQWLDTASRLLVKQDSQFGLPIAVQNRMRQLHQQYGNIRAFPWQLKSWIRDDELADLLENGLPTPNAP